MLDFTTVLLLSFTFAAAATGTFLVVLACQWRCNYAVLLAGVTLHAAAMLFYAHDFGQMNQHTASSMSPPLTISVMFAAFHWISGFWMSRFHPVKSEPSEPERKMWSKMRSVLSWTFTILGSLWWCRAISDYVPQLGLPWLTAFSVLCLTALAGCWMSVRFGWKAAKFPLALVVVATFLMGGALRLLVPFRGTLAAIFLLHTTLFLVFLTRVLLPITDALAGVISVSDVGYVLGGVGDIFFTLMAGVGYAAISNQATQDGFLMNTASYFAGVSASLYLLRNTKATVLYKVALCVSSLAGLALAIRFIDS